MNQAEIIRGTLLADAVALTSRQEGIGPGDLRTKISMRNKSASPVALDEIEVLRLRLNGPGDYFAGEKEIRFLEFDFRLPGLPANFGIFGQSGVNHSEK